MKKIIFLGFITLLFACNPKPVAKVSGTIENQSAEIITISNLLLDTTDSLLITNGSFSAELKVKELGMYYLQNGKYGFRLYLKPGVDINLSFDVAQLKKGNFTNVQITGKGSEESTLINDLKIYRISNLRQTLALPADSFKTTIEENYTQIMSSIDSFKNAINSSKHFYDRIELIKKIEMCEKYMYYTMYHKRLSPQDTMPIPEEFFLVGDDISLNNEELYKELKTYKYFVLQKHDSKIQKQLSDLNLDNESANYANKQIDLIAGLNATQKIKDELGNQLLSSYTYGSDEVKEVYKNRYTEMIKNEEYIQDFIELLNKLEALKPGKKAPSFAYTDINGNKISTEDLKGKVVYVDVWATWCGPCKGEIPHLKALEKELHDLNIAFVSVSVDSDKDAWQKMVEEKELKGYQLHADKDWKSAIIKDYAIKGIPHFILIDKEGNLVDSNAKRPSNAKIKDELIELAKS